MNKVSDIIPDGKFSNAKKELLKFENGANQIVITKNNQFPYSNMIFFIDKYLEYYHPNKKELKKLPFWDKIEFIKKELGINTEYGIFNIEIYNAVFDPLFKALKKSASKLSNAASSIILNKYKNPNIEKLISTVVDELEGGYFHPDMFKDPKSGLSPSTKNKRLYQNSGETMMGIDRKNSSIEKTQLGSTFWETIDSAKSKNPQAWKKWGYRGGEHNNRLLELASKIFDKRYSDYLNHYIKDTNYINTINSYSPLTFNFIYATWNGRGWFNYFSKVFKDAYQSGITNPVLLFRIITDARLDQDIINNGSLGFYKTSEPLYFGSDNGKNTIAKSGKKIKNLFLEEYNKSTIA